MHKIEQVKKIFIDQEEDPEFRIDNQKRIDEWQAMLSVSELALSWQEHEYTRNLVSKLQTEYKFLGIRLATERDLTDDQRKNIFNKQDAISLVLTLILPDLDPKQTIEDINKEIETAINAT